MKKATPKKQTRKKISSQGASMIEKLHTNDDVKRYIGAVTEHFEHQVSAVAEQFGSLQQKLDSHTEMIGYIHEDVQIIKTNVDFLKSALRAKVDYQDFEALEKRVRLVEAKLHR